MPDWIHAVLMIIIWLAVVYLSISLVGGIPGIILGVSAGYLVAGQIVQRVPGFWGERSLENRKDKKQ